MEDPEFDAYVAHVINELVPKIEQSACTISIVPKSGTDIKFAVELGVSIMLDKPIILAVIPGTQVPEHLARVADGVIEFDPDNPLESQRQMRDVIERLGLLQ